MSCKPVTSSVTAALGRIFNLQAITPTMPRISSLLGPYPIGYVLSLCLIGVAEFAGQFFTPNARLAGYFGGIASALSCFGLSHWRVSLIASAVLISLSLEEDGYYPRVGLAALAVRSMFRDASISVAPDAVFSLMIGIFPCRVAVALNIIAELLRLAPINLFLSFITPSKTVRAIALGLVTATSVAAAATAAISRLSDAHGFASLLTAAFFASVAVAAGWALEREASSSRRSAAAGAQPLMRVAKGEHSGQAEWQVRTMMMMGGVEGIYREKRFHRRQIFTPFPPSHSGFAL